VTVDVVATEVVDSTGAINVVLVDGAVSDPGALVVGVRAVVAGGVTVVTAVGEAATGSDVGSSVVQAGRTATRAAASARVVGRRRRMGRVGARGGTGGQYAGGNPTPSHHCLTIAGASTQNA
jgi:hypothetical protein